MTEYERAVVETALREMCKPHGHFNICTVDQILKVLKIAPPQREYEAIRLLHCVSWRDMSAEIRDETIRMLLGWFLLPAFDPFAPTHALPSAKPGFFRALLGGKVV